MFISKRGHGYYDGHGQHSGRGLYLALFAWNDFKAQDELAEACPDCTKCRARRAAWDANPTYPVAPEIFQRRCETHQALRSGLPIPKYPNGNGKLWATTRQCSLHQLGHFMMGTIRIGGKSITVSGPIGHDGLPLDLQEVPRAWRDKLVELPEDVATAYWGDNGHNDVGRAAPTLREWALSAFKEVK